MPSTDQYLPIAHLRPPRNWINDPNGLCYHDGHYHVFFQYNPHGPHHANMHWGHFRSPDLLTWEPLPIALAPTPGGEDADGCFSGNAVSEGDRLVAFYSAFRQDRWSQPVTTAESRDGGRTFRPRGTLLIPEPPEGCTMYRDPYVWQDAAGWKMLIGAALADGRASALLYESHDLENWTYRGPFCAREPLAVNDTGALTGEGWECPQYLPADDGRGALIVSAWNHKEGPQRTIALTGEASDGTFQAGAPVLLDHGPDCYAPALLPGPNGRWLMWGWSWEARDDAWSATDGWAGTLTIPREIFLADDGTLRQQPAAELQALRGRHAIWAEGHSSGPEPVDLGEVGRAFDLTARLDASSDASLRLLTTADDSEYLDIRLEPVTGELVVDRNYASKDPRARRGSYRMPCPSSGPVDLRIVVDKSIAEVFLGNGQVLTVRFYPTGDDPWRLQMRTARAARLDYVINAWELLPLTIPASAGESRGMEDCLA